MKSFILLLLYVHDLILWYLFTFYDLICIRMFMPFANCYKSQYKGNYEEWGKEGSKVGSKIDSL